MRKTVTVIKKMSQNKQYKRTGLLQEIYARGLNSHCNLL